MGLIDSKWQNPKIQTNELFEKVNIEKYSQHKNVSHQNKKCEAIAQLPPTKKKYNLQKANIGCFSTPITYTHTHTCPLADSWFVQTKKKYLQQKKSKRITTSRNRIYGVPNECSTEHCPDQSHAKVCTTSRTLWLILPLTWECCDNLYQDNERK